MGEGERKKEDKFQKTRILNVSKFSSQLPLICCLISEFSFFGYRDTTIKKKGKGRSENLEYRSSENIKN